MRSTRDYSGTTLLTDSLDSIDLDLPAIEGYDGFSRINLDRSH